MPEVKRALALFNEAIAMEPDDNYSGLVRRKDLYRAIGMYEEAIQDVTRIIEENKDLVRDIPLRFSPSGASWYRERGDCYRKLGNLDKANEDYKVAEALEALRK